MLLLSYKIYLNYQKHNDKMGTIDILNWVLLAYIAIPLIAVIVIWIYRKSISPDGFAKITEIYKWYIVSVAIVISSQLIQSSFTERETGIREMQVYEKYAQEVLKAGNIEERWRLAQYFASVTPTKRLRDRWIIYRDEVKPEYETFISSKKVEQQLTAKDSLTPQQKTELSQAQDKVESLNKPLVGTTAVGNWIIVFTGDTNTDQATTELNNLKKAGINNPRLVLRSGSYRTISESFGSKAEAQNYLNTKKNVVRSDAYVINMDLWCPNPVFNGQYYECK